MNSIKEKMNLNKEVARLEIADDFIIDINTKDKAAIFQAEEFIKAKRTINTIEDYNQFIDEYWSVISDLLLSTKDCERLRDAELTEDELIALLIGVITTANRKSLDEVNERLKQKKTQA